MNIDPADSAADSDGNPADDFKTDEEMRAALDRGEATTLSRLIVDHVRYQESWWCAFPGGWFRINDPELTGYLDKRQSRFRQDLPLEKGMSERSNP